MIRKGRKKNILIKIYIAVLFFCGVGIWFSIRPSEHKYKIPRDVILNKKIVDVLVANGIVQDNIVNQYVRKATSKTAKWNEFYKTIKLKTNKTTQSLETAFRSVARSMKVSLSKTENDDGSITYKFYLPKRNYSNITLISQKEER